MVESAYRDPWGLARMVVGYVVRSQMDTYQNPYEIELWLEVTEVHHNTIRAHSLLVNFNERVEAAHRDPRAFDPLV